MANDSRCIGVFDSGIGGLTVVRALRRRLPGESIVYFGDTARVPYGIKSTETVTRFAREDCEFLLRFDPKIIVAACNTASAAALPSLKKSLPVPVVGVVEPGANAAVARANGRPIAVIATEATINSGAYRKAMHRIRPELRIIEKACPLFVPIAEEGRACDDPITAAIARDYLEPMLKLGPGALVMGCTHYPLLRSAIRGVVGEQVELIDSGHEAAEQVAKTLDELEATTSASGAGDLSCYVSDNPQRFREIGQRFLDQPIVSVTWISPEQFLGAPDTTAASA